MSCEAFAVMTHLATFLLAVLVVALYFSFTFPKDKEDIE